MTTENLGLIGTLAGVAVFTVALTWPKLSALFAKWKAGSSKPTPDGTTRPLPRRGADEVAPPGTADYIKDLMAAAPQAPADFVLEQALAEKTLAQTQKLWIQALLKQRGGVKQDANAPADPPKES